MLLRFFVLLYGVVRAGCWLHDVDGVVFAGNHKEVWVQGYGKEMEGIGRMSGRAYSTARYCRWRPAGCPPGREAATTTGGCRPRGRLAGRLQTRRASITIMYLRTINGSCNGLDSNVACVAQSLYLPTWGSQFRLKEATLPQSFIHAAPLGPNVSFEGVLGAPPPKPPDTDSAWCLSEVRIGGHYLSERSR